MKRPRVVIVTNIPAPYRVDLFNAISHRGRYELYLLFCARNEPNRPWDEAPRLECQYRVLPGVSATVGGRPVHINPSCFADLARCKPDAVVVWGFGPSAWISWLYAKFSGCALLTFSGGTALSDGGIRGARQRLRRLQIAASAACIAASGDARQYLLSLGADQKRVFISLETFDLVRFEEQVNKARRSLGTKHGDRVTILYAGRLIPGKGLAHLLRAYGCVRRERESVRLRVVGNGPEEAALRHLAAEGGLEDVEFRPAVTPKAVPGLYADADIVVLPTLLDTFGLAVTEGLVAGVPVVCSTRAGVADALIEDGLNGFLWTPPDERNLAGLLIRLVDDVGLRRRMGEHARQVVEKASLEKAVEGFEQALGWALRSGAAPREERVLWKGRD